MGETGPRIGSLQAIVMNLGCTNVEPPTQSPVEAPAPITRKKKYNIWPVIIACCVFGVLIFVGTIVAVVLMRKRQKQDSPVKPVEDEKPVPLVQDANPTDVALEVVLP